MILVASEVADLRLSPPASNNPPPLGKRKILQWGVRAYFGGGAMDATGLRITMLVVRFSDSFLQHLTLDCCICKFEYPMGGLLSTQNDCHKCLVKGRVTSATRLKISLSCICRCGALNSMVVCAICLAILNHPSFTINVALCICGISFVIALISRCTASLLQDPAGSCTSQFEGISDLTRESLNNHSTFDGIAALMRSSPTDFPEEWGFIASCG